MTDIKKAIEHSIDWQDATCQIIDIWTTEEGRPFSSGEIARELRIHRPDFRFGQRELGDFVRSLYWSQHILYRDAMGKSFMPYQVSRTTKGNSRTPGGLLVFVYAPTQATGEVHDFEVDIPDPTSSSAGDVPAGVVAAISSLISTPTTRAANKKDGHELIATVQGDGRMRIPRSVFDSWSIKNKRILKGGDSVWIKVEENNPSIDVFFDPPQYQDGCEQFSITHDKCAVKFSSPKYLTSFIPGRSYKVFVYRDRVTIDLMSM